MNWQIREWNARRRGKADGESAYPSMRDTECTYLITLKKAGEGRLVRLGLRWKWANLFLYPAWAKAVVRQYQAEAALEKAWEREKAAQATWTERKTVKNKKALHKATKAVARAQARLDRTHYAVVRTRARRVARFQHFQSQFDAILKETEHLQGLYCTANLEHREDNCEPPALMEKNWPCPRVPADLAELRWVDPLTRWDRPAPPPSASL